MISYLKDVWDDLVSTGSDFAEDSNQKTRMAHANLMSILSFLTMFMFAIVFACLDLFVLSIILSVFMTLNVLAIVICQQGKFNTTRILYVLISNATIFMFSNILGEQGAVQFFYFALIPCVFTFFAAKERELLLVCVFISPLLWVCSELFEYKLFNFSLVLSHENLNMIKFLSVSASFIIMFIFLHNFLVMSYKNEALSIVTISTLKIKERELLNKNEEFTHTTKELMSIQQLLSANQANLEKEKSKVERALKVKTDFLSSMSHEIRTPMNVIVGLTDFLIENEDDPEKLENLELVKNSSDNLLVIINDILDFSRMESGKLIIENIDFDLHRKVKDVIKSLSIRTKGSSNILKLNIDDNVPQSITSDPVRITQVLMNLLSNANKFTKNGTVELIVTRVKSITSTKSLIRFEVRDSGIGIAEDALSKIFESFTQASSSTTRQYGGTGLGLPISKRIVELMDGEIWVESTPDVGSSFFFELNLKHKEIRNNLTKRIDDKYCLVCEDFEMNQLFMANVFEGLGLKCEFAVDFDEMVLKSQEKPYVFILLDITKEGFEKEHINTFIDRQNKFSAALMAFKTDESKGYNQEEIIFVSHPINKNEIRDIITVI